MLLIYHNQNTAIVSIGNIINNVLITLYSARWILLNNSDIYLKLIKCCMLAIF